MVERVFTKDVGRNFHEGEKRDYPQSTWDQIAKNAKQKLDKITKLVTHVEPSATETKKMAEGTAPPA